MCHELAPLLQVFAFLADDPAFEKRSGLTVFDLSSELIRASQPTGGRAVAVYSSPVFGDRNSPLLVAVTLA